MREKESKTEGKKKGKGERCWCVDASWALGHDAKPPLNQTAVGCRTDIIFNEIITYTEKMYWLGSVPFMLGIWEYAVLIDMNWLVALISLSHPLSFYHVSYDPTVILKFVHSEC